MQLGMKAVSFATFASSALSVDQQGTTVSAANPIRKVVTLLQKMEKDVQSEAEKEQALFDKFMCYCKNSGSDLSASIGSGNTQISQLGTDIKASEEELVQTKDDLAQAQNDRSAAKTAMAEATAMRESEAAAFAAEKAEYDATIHAIVQAVGALEKGMSGTFLQTPAAELLKKAITDKVDMMDDDRSAVVSFLSGSQDASYTPSSQQVTGILKQMGDEMAANLKAATDKENEAIQAYNSLMAAKRKEFGALSKAIEAKLKHVGELSVSIAQMKNELTDTEESLLADQAFLAGLEKSCATKKSEWEERVKTRGDELAALADAIRMLNDDDALELFKKTLPSASASFVQVQVAADRARAKALSTLQRARNFATGNPVGLDLISLALHGKKIGFTKVIGMIDEMVKNLKQEQLDDDNKKEYCAAQFDFSDDSKKSLERTVSDEDAAISTTEEGIATSSDEIKALENAIKSLDKSVASATQQRKDEHDEFNDLMASNSAAKELLGLVKNRLNKFYNPKLYKAAPKRELSADDRIMVNQGIAMAPTEAPGGIAGTGITVLAEVAAHVQSSKDAPPPPPETFGAYAKKSGESGGVLKLMNMLIADLDKEMTEAETQEQDAQGDYEALMRDSASKRAADSKTLTEKESTKASLEGDLESHNEAKARADKQLAATNQYIHELHAECDWLLKYFDTRREARASEIDALGNAKAVLSGADYSFVQTGTRMFLGKQ